MLLRQLAIDTAHEGHYTDALEHARAYEAWAQRQPAGPAREQALEKANLLVGNLLARMGYYEDAGQRLRRAIQADDPADALDAVLAYTELIHTAEAANPIRTVLVRIEQQIEMDSSPEGDRMRAMCRYVRGRLIYYDQSPEAAAPLIESAMNSPEVFAEDRVPMHIQYSRCMRFAHGPFEAEHEARQALSLAEDINSVRLAARARSRIAAFLLDAGKHEEAKRELLQTVRDLDGTGLHGDLADVCNALGELDRFLGNTKVAQAWYERSVAIWDKLGSLTSGGFPRFNLLYLILDSGRSEGAREHLAILDRWAMTQRAGVRRALELQRIRLTFIEGRHQEVLDRLTLFFEQSTELSEVDDAMTLEWLVSRYMGMPPQNLSPLSILRSADCLTAAQRFWESLDRSKDVQRVRFMREQLKDLVQAQQ